MNIYIMARKSKKVSYPKFLNKLLQNKIVLYLVMFIALINVITYFSNQDYTSITLFVVIGLLMKCFTNNMILILGVPIVIVSLLLAGHVFTKVKAYEGFKEGMEHEEEDEEKDEKEGKDSFAVKKNKVANFEGLQGIQNQQKQIMENITSLAPVLREATSVLKNVDMEKMTTIMDRMSKQKMSAP